MECKTIVLEDGCISECKDNLIKCCFENLGPFYFRGCRETEQKDREEKSFSSEEGEHDRLNSRGSC